MNVKRYAREWNPIAHHVLSMQTLRWRCYGYQQHEKGFQSTALKDLNGLEENMVEAWPLQGRFLIRFKTNSVLRKAPCSYYR
jgi:hypothetical protein